MRVPKPFVPGELKGTFQVVDLTSWAKDLAVEIASYDVINMLVRRRCGSSPTEPA